MSSFPQRHSRQDEKIRTEQMCTMPQRAVQALQQLQWEAATQRWVPHASQWSRKQQTSSRNTTTVSKTHNSLFPQLQWSWRGKHECEQWTGSCVIPAPLVLEIQPVTLTTLVLLCSWSVTTGMSQGATQPAGHQGRVTAPHTGISEYNLHVSPGGQKCNVLI